MDYDDLTALGTVYYKALLDYYINDIQHYSGCWYYDATIDLIDWKTYRNSVTGDTITFSGLCTSAGVFELTVVQIISGSQHFPEAVLRADGAGVLELQCKLYNLFECASGLPSRFEELQYSLP